MNHMLLELLPLFAGCACGLIIPPTCAWLRLWPLAIVLGALAAGFAGELTHGPAEAAVALVVDSGGVLAGVLLTRWVRRLAPKRPD